jgi:hypothetical protein
MKRARTFARLVPRLPAREWRVLALATIFFVSGLVFFAERGATDARDAATPLQIQTSDSLMPHEQTPSPRESLAKLPAPETFQTFTYTGQESIGASGTCTDAYYALLIYPKEIDYRASPLDAKYNTATACTDRSFITTIALAPLHLEKGHSYYVVKAQQGAKNGWYNPY